MVRQAKQHKIDSPVESKSKSDVEFQRLALGNIFTASYATVKDTKTDSFEGKVAYFTGAGEDEGIVFSTSAKSIVKSVEKGTVIADLIEAKESGEEGIDYEIIGRQSSKSDNVYLVLSQA